MNGIQVFLAAYAQPLIWLAVALVMLIIEAATVQMVSIWFCLGAVAAAIAAILGGSIPVQIIVFVVISGVTLAFTRKFVKKVLRVKKTPTNADSVIGAIGQVVEPIDDEAGTGRIKAFSEMRFATRSTRWRAWTGAPAPPMAVSCRRA